MPDPLCHRLLRLPRETFSEIGRRAEVITVRLYRLDTLGTIRVDTHTSALIGIMIYCPRHGAGPTPILNTSIRWSIRRGSAVFGRAPSSFKFTSVPVGGSKHTEGPPAGSLGELQARMITGMIPARGRHWRRAVHKRPRVGGHWHWHHHGGTGGGESGPGPLRRALPVP